MFKSCFWTEKTENFIAVSVDLFLQDAGVTGLGFLLGSLNVQVALTSEACYKGLPKAQTGEVVTFKGWPKLQWFVTEHLSKCPKDWNPPPRQADDAPAYIEVCVLCSVQCQVGSLSDLIKGRSGAICLKCAFSVRVLPQGCSLSSKMW